MKLILGNVKCKAVIGGSDNLLDFDVMQELRKYLRIRPKGYNHSEAYRKHRWDGYRYFITKAGFFATGFLPLIVDYLEDMGVELEVVDERDDIPKLKTDKTNVVGNIDGDKWIAQGKFDYQFEAIKTLENYIEINGVDYYFPRGIMNCATNAGKTSIAALILNNLEPNNTVIFMVSSRTIYEQSVEFFSQVIGEPVGEIKSGKYNPKGFTVCMVRTLYNRAKDNLNTRKFLKEVDVLMVDESDEAGAKEYSKLLTYVGAGMRVFLSGTPLDSSKVNNMISIGLSGKILNSISNKELIERGVSQRPIVNILLNRTESYAFENYDQQLTRVIHTSKHRVELIKEVIEKHENESILITFTELEHGYFMHENLQRDYNVGIAHGSSSDRDETLDKFKSGETQILLASQILQRGANIPNIRVLIMAHGGKSKRIIKQYTGRALRADGKHKEVYIYDFYDMGKIVSKHSRDRIRIYKSEGFEVIENYETYRNKPKLK